MNTEINKNLIPLPLIFLSIFSINQCYAITVGESYGGGTVFCVSQTPDTTKCEITGSGDYGLIMANVDQANYDSNPKHGIIWSGKYKEIGPSAQSLDNGKANTDTIIKAHPSDNPDNNAAHLCRSYRDPKEGHTDWYLPSTNELNKIYVYAKANNLIGKGCSGSKADGIQCLVGGGYYYTYTANSSWNSKNEYKIYWSSSEFSGNDGFSACYQYFSNGYQDNGCKIGDYLGVRAVRAFNNSTTETEEPME